LLVISEMMGIPRADRAMLKRQADERMLSALSLEPDRMRRGAAGIRESSEYLHTQLELRLAEPRDDLLQVLAEAQRAHHYSREEAVANAQTLIDAGHETTIQLLCNGMLAFMRHPDQWELLRSDPRGLAAAATEECLRFDAPIPSLRRIAASDVGLRGKQIRAGDRVSWVIAAANRDPRVYADPDRFDITRSASQHLAFGFGAHYCLGQFLGRIEGQEVFIAMAQRFPSLRLATESLSYARVRGIRRLMSLPVTW
jgi:cytochrome P450